MARSGNGTHGGTQEHLINNRCALRTENVCYDHADDHYCEPAGIENVEIDCVVTISYKLSAARDDLPLLLVTLATALTTIQASQHCHPSDFEIP